MANLGALPISWPAGRAEEAMSSPASAGEPARKTINSGSDVLDGKAGAWIEREAELGCFFAVLYLANTIKHVW